LAKNDQKDERKNMTIIPPQRISPEKAPEPLAVNSREASKMLGISERTLYKLAKAGKIKCKKIGWRSLYVVASIKSFLEAPNENQN